MRTGGERGEMSDCGSVNWIPAAPAALLRGRLVSARTRRPLVGAGEKEGGREGLQLSLDGGKVSREHRYMI